MPSLCLQLYLLLSITTVIFSLVSKHFQTPFHPKSHTFLYPSRVPLIIQLQFIPTQPGCCWPCTQQLWANSVSPQPQNPTITSLFAFNRKRRQQRYNLAKRRQTTILHLVFYWGGWNRELNPEPFRIVFSLANCLYLHRHPSLPPQCQFQVFFQRQSGMHPEYFLHFA